MFNDKHHSPTSTELLDRPAVCAICSKKNEAGMETFCASVASTRHGEEAFLPCEFADLTPKHIHGN